MKGSTHTTYTNAAGELKVISGVVKPTTLRKQSVQRAWYLDRDAQGCYCNKREVNL